jgi:hypothetical protein
MPDPITPLPPAPTRDDIPADFVSKSNTFLAAMPTMVTEINAYAPTIAGTTSSAAAAAASATTATNYATKVDAYASGTDNSSKSWAVGGTGTGQPAAGDAKSWATLTTDYVTGTENSAQSWAIGGTGNGQPAAGDAKTWALASAASAASAVSAPGTTATSSTSLTIATGVQSLTVQTGKSIVPGMWVTIASTASPAVNWMAGIVTAYTTGTGALDVSVQGIAGSGTIADWTVALSAPVFPIPETAKHFLFTYNFGGF